MNYTSEKPLSPHPFYFLSFSYQVRAMRASGEKGDIDVVIEDGTYVLGETLIFGLEDSAPVGAVTRYRGSAPLFFNFNCKLIKYVKYEKF